MHIFDNDFFANFVPAAVFLLEWICLQIELWVSTFHQIIIENLIFCLFSGLDNINAKGRSIPSHKES